MVNEREAGVVSEMALSKQFANHSDLFVVYNYQRIQITIAL